MEICLTPVVLALLLAAFRLGHRQGWKLFDRAMPRWWSHATGNAVHVYRRTGTVWKQQAYVVAGLATDGDLCHEEFGIAEERELTLLDRCMAL